MLGSLAAVAADATDPSTIITSATTSLLPQLALVAGAGIAVSAGLLGLKKGWGLFTKMIKA